ncbi:TRAP transporter small permease [Cohaesibacter gelatinilyticus]|uniref:TRAP transporter small permease protein n=1 Tax=Cohaesibacter gelatinilyticus TaxID=372072 RepID=A0A285PII1_9HYPH|nr:TRAP transporter small permease subunit [Cohaesibacter gelatinilyticus]SNZ21525.1 TRAP-type C4-dicarboxylate transport system, small permease component [Cohaesibacter gelatinilyticus]HAT85746.1 C4-dicarboxylate ABC transporter [Hyphomicrobiales bacterium]
MELADGLPPRFGRLVRKLVTAKLAMSAIATLILPLTFLMVVIFRYILHWDLFAYEEWLLPISFWLYFLACGVGSYQDTQIRADILESYFKSARAIWLRRLCLHVVETLICFVMLYWTYLLLDSGIAQYPYWQKTIALKIPFFVAHLGIFLGVFFMAFYGLLHVYVLVRFGPQMIREPSPVQCKLMGEEQCC